MKVILNIVAALFLVILLMGSVSAYTLFETVKYDNGDTEATIGNFFGLGRDLAKATLITPMNNYVIRGKDRLVAEFDVEVYETLEEVFISDLDLYDNNINSGIFDSKNKFERETTFKQKVIVGYEDRQVFETICPETYVKNLTFDGMQTNCYKELDYVTSIPIYDWELIDVQQVLPFGNVTIGIFTDVRPNENIEWIPTLFGVEVKGWAEWTEGLEVDLWGWYDFDSDASDAQGNASRDGSAAGNPTYRPGLIGNAIHFDGTDDYVGMLNPNFSDGDFAIAFWLNYTEGARLFGNNGSTYPDVGIGGYILANELQYHADTGAGGWNILNGATDLNIDLTPNTWEHIVIMRNSTGFFSYFNGAYIGTDATAGSLAGQTAQFAIGKHYDGEATLTGEVDNFGIWLGRDLSTAEVIQLYNSGAGITYDSGDATPPNVTINSPLNATYNSFPLNFTATAIDDTQVDDCWVTIDGGTTNYSMFNTTTTPSAYNYSLNTLSDIGYLAEFYCNDTTGNINDTETVSFLIDTINPELNITYPVNLTSFSYNTIDVNYTSNDTNIGSCWYSNGTYEYNTSLTDCSTNITTVLWVDGEHTVTIWANDSAGNTNS